MMFVSKGCELIRSYTYRIDGKYYKKDQLMMFDLDKAKKNPRK